MSVEILYTILLILLGYFFKKIKVLKVDDGEVISRIIFNITLPALVIVSLNSVVIEPSIILMPILVIIFGFMSIILAYFVFKNEQRDMKGTFMMLASGYNVGLFAFPIVEAIWGAEGLLYFGMFDIGNTFIVFGIAYVAGSIYSEDGLSLKPVDLLRKFSRSIPLMTYVIMCILNFINVDLPNSIVQFTSIISKANMPLSLILLGLYLNFTIDKRYTKKILKFLAYRYGFGLLIGLGCFFFLPFNEMFRYTLLIGLLLPIGLSVIPYAYEFKYKTIQLIGSLSNLCIFISIVLMTIIFSVIA